MNNQTTKNLKRRALLLLKRAKLEQALLKPGISTAVRDLLRAVLKSLPTPDH